MHWLDLGAAAEEGEG